MLDYRISAALDEVIRENTFTREALEQFQEAIDGVKKLESEVKELEERLAKAKDEHEKTAHERAEAQGTLALWMAREKELSDREASVVENEKKTSVAEAKAQVWETCYLTAFKNTVVRRSVQRSVPQPTDSYMTTAMDTEEVSEE